MDKGVIRFIMVFAIALLVSSLLMTIEWFTFGACLFVALMLTWKYYLSISRAENLVTVSKFLAKKIDELKTQKKTNTRKPNTQMSTKKTNTKKKTSKNAE